MLVAINIIIATLAKPLPGPNLEACAAPPIQDSNQQLLDADCSVLTTEPRLLSKRVRHS